MKKITSMIGIIIFLFLITSCNHKDVEDISADTTQHVEETKNQHRWGTRCGILRTIETKVKWLSEAEAETDKPTPRGRI